MTPRAGTAGRSSSAGEPCAADPTAADDALLATATDLVVESGLHGFSMDELARRARVSKSTIYKRWPSRHELVVDVCSQVRDLGDAARTGDVALDVRAVLERLHQAFSSPRLSPVIVAATDAAERDPAIADLQRQVSARAHADLEDALRRGIDASQLDPGTDVELVAELLVGPLFYRRFFKRAEVTPAAIDRVCASVLAPLVVDGP